MAGDIELGVMLPHFGQDTSRDYLTRIARLADELGFGSLWTRDHLYIPPEHQEHGGITEKEFLETFQTLAHVNAVTGDIDLGTCVANAHRRPLKLSQHFGTLDVLSDGDVVCGGGAGTFRGEFAAMDLPFEKQGQMADEMLDVLRRTFTESRVSHDGEVFSFEDVTINPRPGDDMPSWYAGLSPIAVKRAFRYADGWFPGRMPFETIDERLALLDDLESEHGRTLDRSYVTIYNVDEDPDRARETLNLDRLVDDVNNLLRADYDSPGEVEGSFVAGDPTDCVETLERFADRGFGHVVLDARHDFEGIERVLELTADEVLPALR